MVAATGDRTEQRAQQAALAYLAELDRLGLGPDDAVRLVRQLRPAAGTAAGS